VVKRFKLLGVTIDDKLNFEKYTCELRSTILRKMYSIKKLFQLARSVKIQFSKSFISPHFDYCSTFTIFFGKDRSIPRTANTYNYTVFYKLLKFESECKNNEELNLFNNLQLTYSHFFDSKLINNLLLDDIKLKFTSSKQRIKNNINSLFLKFINVCPKFDITYGHKVYANDSKNNET
jgi:hypothetical protein